MYLYEGDAFRFVAQHNAPLAFVEARTRDPIVRPPPDTPLGRVGTTKQVSHIADIRTVPSYVSHDPFIVSAVELGNYRAVLAVPMLKKTNLSAPSTSNDNRLSRSPTSRSNLSATLQNKP